MSETDKENQKTEVEILKEKLEQAEKEKNEYLDGWKRAKADLINYKKEETTRFQDFVYLSISIFMRELITVLDSFAAFKRTLEDEPLASADASRSGRSEEPSERDPKGVLMIESQLINILKKFGLEEIVVSVGQPFDPSRQEAVGEIESSQPVGTIAEEVEKGYLLNGRVLKPTKVKLSK